MLELQHHTAGARNMPFSALGGCAATFLSLEPVTGDFNDPLQRESLRLDAF